jgi:hypothetical protein
MRILPRNRITADKILMEGARFFSYTFCKSSVISLILDFGRTFYEVLHYSILVGVPDIARVIILK